MKSTLTKRIRNWVSEFRRRLRDDGAGQAWKWLYGHGVPTVLRIPIVKYHRVTDQIFLGPQHGKLGRRILAHAGITASVSMRTGYSDVERGVGFAKYCHLPTVDGTPPTLRQLDEGVNFIRHVIDDGGRVYIHCQTGLGRGPTMAVAFLISEGRPLEEAYKMVQAVRPFTDIRPMQLEILRAFEREAFHAGNRAH